METEINPKTRESKSERQILNLLRAEANSTNGSINGLGTQTFLRRTLPGRKFHESVSTICIRLLLTASVLSWHALSVHAETKLDFWHSYIHQPSGVPHFSFQIANYKKGIFFGSCGPSTRSLKWEFDIDLAGKGPTFTKDEIRIMSDAKPVEVVSGTVTIGPSEREATISLRVKASGSEIQFAGNGTHRIVKVK